jgi:DNA-binding LacI/PurR family transcriptional regulator
LLLHTRREVNDLVQATQASLVDGVIIIGAFHLADEFRYQAGGKVQPCVFINISKAESVDHIFIDLRPAVEEALRMMLSGGRQRIAYVVNNRDADSHTETRMATYLKFMEEAQRVPEFIDVNTSTSPEERVQAIKAYIELHDCPDALLCQNDETAIYTYRALTRLGLRLPDDVVLVGCDGLPYMEFFDPPLSTIALPTEDICALATQFLQRRMTHPDIPFQEATFQGHLVVRKSMELGVSSCGSN